MKVVYSRQKTIQIYKRARFAAHILDSKLKDQSGALHSPFFTILHNKRNIFSFLAIFSDFIYRTGGSVYEVSYPFYNTLNPTCNNYVPLLWPP